MSDTYNGINRPNFDPEYFAGYYSGDGRKNSERAIELFEEWFSRLPRREPSRLEIAAMILAALLSNPGVTQISARTVFEHVDALIVASKEQQE